MTEYVIRRIHPEETDAWVLNRHYARRRPGITHAFGAFEGNRIVGIVTYGMPFSHPLRSTMMGGEHICAIRELNRLCTERGKNLPSQLVGKSLQMLPHPTPVVSFADTSMSHAGFIYQATNWIYTGKNKPTLIPAVRGTDMHHMAFIDGARRVNLSLDEYMLKNYGDRYHKKYSTVKHRYVYFVGDKRQRKAMAKQLTWPIVTPYPKMAPDHYYDSAQIKIQLALF